MDARTSFGKCFMFMRELFVPLNDLGVGMHEFSNPNNITPHPMDSIQEL